MDRMRRLCAATLLLLLAPLAASGSESMTVRLAGHRFTVELARTPQERAVGLMHREGLPEGTGMLFVYERSQPVSFWNKNVAFPIDILYFGDDRRLLRIDARIPPCLAEECPTYRRQKGVRLVLELPGGTAERIGLAPGALLQFL